MRRTALLTFAASALLALAACGETGAPESEGASDAAGTGQPAATDSNASSAGPDTPVSDTATSEATPTPTTTRKVDSNPPGDECGASQVATFVDQKATPAVRARLQAEVGHDRIRWVGPDTIVTMDFRPDRLNVMLDKNDVITGGKCS